MKRGGFLKLIAAAPLAPHVAAAAPVVANKRYDRLIVYGLRTENFALVYSGFQMETMMNEITGNMDTRISFNMHLRRAGEMYDLEAHARAQ